MNDSMPPDSMVDLGHFGAPTVLDDLTTTALVTIVLRFDRPPCRCGLVAMQYVRELLEKRSAGLLKRWASTEPTSKDGRRT